MLTVDTWDLEVAEFGKFAEAVRKSDGDAIRARWNAGHYLASLRTGKKQLPNGLLDKLVEQYKVHPSDLHAWMKFATKYPTEAELSTAVETYKSWTALRDTLWNKVDVEDTGGDANQGDDAAADISIDRDDDDQAEDTPKRFAIDELVGLPEPGGKYFWLPDSLIERLSQRADEDGTDPSATVWKALTIGLDALDAKASTSGQQALVELASDRNVAARIADTVKTRVIAAKRPQTNTTDGLAPLTKDADVIAYYKAHAVQGDAEFVLDRRDRAPLPVALQTAWQALLTDVLEKGKESAAHRKERDRLRTATRVWLDATSEQPWTRGGASDTEQLFLGPPPEPVFVQPYDVPEMPLDPVLALRQ